MDISVVVPLYNKARTVSRAIGSVLDQPHIREVVVVDDGSTDESAAIVEDKFGDRVRLIRQHNQGPGIARNVGASVAGGDVLAFLDADDEWLPGFPSAGMAALQAHPDAVAYACSYDTGNYAAQVPDKVSKITSRPALLPPPNLDMDPGLLRSYINGLHSSSALVRRSAFDEAGGYFDRWRCLWGEDSYLWGQVLFLGPIFWDPHARIKYHIADSNLGFAIKNRNACRPLVLLGGELLPRMRPDRCEAFWKLVRCLAEEDAHDLVASGHLLAALKLQRRFNLLSFERLILDFRAYVRHWRQGQR